MTYFVSTSEWVSEWDLIKLFRIFFSIPLYYMWNYYAEPRVKEQSHPTLLLSNLFSFILYSSLLVSYELI